MKFKVHSEVEYWVNAPGTIIFNIQALRASYQTILEEKLEMTPEMKIEELNTQNGSNRFTRIQVKENTSFKISYSATVVNNYKFIDQSSEWGEVSIGNLDGEIIPFLFPSRYCQSDKLFRLANSKFGKIESLYQKVLAITDWIYENVEYLSGSTNSQTSAYDTVTELVGVCRDFAHLGIALCRALSIPARYFTGYAFKLYPPDFHACFEAYIGGSWILFDATKLVPLNGLVKIGSGRDAADAAVATIFGDVTTTSIQVGCESLEDNFVPFYYDKNQMRGISYH